MNENKTDDRRRGTERALHHHGIKYRLALTQPLSRTGNLYTFLIDTRMGTRSMTLREAEAFCLGLSTKENAHD